jgi:LEA14-like dessication related protein
MPEGTLTNRAEYADNKKNMKKRRFFFFFLFLLFCCLTCKSPPPPPPPEEKPVADLRFDRIEAESIHQVSLFYRLRVENPRSAPLILNTGGWKAVVDGLEYDRKAAALEANENSGSGPLAEIPGGGFAEKTLRLDLDLGASGEPAVSGDPGNYQAELLLDLVYQYGGEKPLAGEAFAIAEFPRIREPEFTITAIAILQAELINTRFRVNLRIDNPNVFPVDLSSFGYELYGAGRFWADGRETGVLHIPAQSSAETKLLLMMNFINMKRSLLDEVIAMQQVRYRFTGEAEVGTGVSWLPWFRMGFDHSGHSEVYK